MKHEWIQTGTVELDFGLPFKFRLVAESAVEHCRVCGDARSIGSTYDGPCPGKDSR